MKKPFNLKRYRSDLSTAKSQVSNVRNLQFDVFKINYFLNEKNIKLPLSQAIEDPKLEKVKELLPLCSGDDSIYAERANTKVAFEKQENGFLITINTDWFYDKDCSIEETIKIIDNIEGVIKDPLKYGFLEDGTDEYDANLE